MIHQLFLFVSGLVHCHIPRQYAPLVASSELSELRLLGQP